MNILKPDGTYYNPKNPGNVRIGLRAATKGEVACWDDAITLGRREFGMISGVGEIIKGPDAYDRYLVRLKGCRVWIERNKFVVG